MPNRITRRSAMGALAAGGFAVAVAGDADAAPRIEAAASAAPDVLRAGARFGRWSVAAVHPVEHGALRVDVLCDEAQGGHTFTLEIMTRDPSPLAPRPPAEVGELAIYVRNGGDGWLPTVEEQGLAAMGLAELLRLHGHGASIQGLLSHAERVVVHQHLPFDGASSNARGPLPSHASHAPPSASRKDD